MAKFKLIVSDPQSGKANVAEIEGSRAQALIGRQVGDLVDGATLAIAPGRVRITGGCDKDGIPMRSDVQGGTKKYVVLSGGVGFKPRTYGERRRKLVRGRMITDETYQVNMVRVLNGEKVPPETQAQPKPVAVTRMEEKVKAAAPAKKKIKKSTKKKARR